MAQLPSDSTNQENGRSASRALGIKLPRSWIEKALDGDSDYGIDYHMQLRNPQFQVEYSFYLQLKGTTVPDFNLDGTISYTFKCSTLRYYHAQEPLVMVAVVNLKDNLDNLHNCPIYYMWLDYEWFKLNKNKLDSQENITLRIPTNQLITPQLDIYEYYNKRIQERIALTDLSNEIKPHTEDLIGTISNIKNKITEKPFFLKALEHNGEEPWVENPEGHYPTELKKIDSYLQNNKLINAKELIDKLENQKDTMSEHELSELWYQHANYLALLGKNDESFELYKKAASNSDKIRYVAAKLESALRQSPSEQAQQILSKINSYPDNDKRILFLRVKCLSLLGRTQDAIDLIEKFHPDYITARLVAYTIVDDRHKLDELIESIDMDSLKSPREKLIVHFMGGRRAYLKAFGESISYDEIIPIYGLPNADPALMKISYDHYIKAWMLMESLGYPQDFTLLLDISPLVFTHFNCIQNLFRHFENILKERPDHSELIYVYTRLLFNQHEYQKIIDLQGVKKEKHNLDDHILLFQSYYNLQKPLNALAIFNGIAESLLASDLSNKASLFCIASRIANGLFEKELSEKYMTIVKSLPGSEAVIALSDFIDNAENNKIEISKNLDVLYNRYIELGRPLFLAEQLISNLHLTNNEDATKYIDVSNKILEHHELSERENLIYAHSLINTGNYDNAISVIDKFLVKNTTNDNWYFLKSLALQNSGKPGLAIDCIRLVLQRPSISDDTIKMYIQLCIKFGLLDEVEKSIIAIISKTSDRKTKVQLLSQLYHVYRQDNKSKRIHVLRQLGNFVDREDSYEEGLFLSYILFVDSADDDLQAEWRQRLTDYTSRFPDSKILKFANVEPESQPDSLLENLNKLTGVTPEILELWDKNKFEIRNGSLPIPFAMRDHFLKDTRNIFTTWSLSRCCSEDMLEFKFRHGRFLPQELFDSLVSNYEKIIIEETSLFTLSELNILDEFLDNQNEYILLESAFNNISKNSQNSIHPETLYLARKMIKSINNHRSKLVVFDDGNLNKIEAYKRLLAGRDSIFLSDDLYMQNMASANNEDNTLANSFNVIIFLMRKQAITKNKAFDYISKICALGVYQPNMTMQLLSEAYYHYFLECEGRDILSTNFKNIFNSIFSSLRDCRETAPILFQMLLLSSSYDDNLPTPDILIELMDSFHQIQSFGEISSLLTTWFIQQCVYSSKRTKNTNPLELSRTHHNIWILYQKAMINISPSFSNEESLLVKIIDKLKIVAPKDRAENYDAIKKCFVPLSQTSLILESKYLSLKYHEQVFFRI